jgi:ubiquinone/menaquinone biosynthesis C-methylase UbiE
VTAATRRDPVARRVDFITQIEALTGPLAGRRVLDLGCGRQAFWTRAYVARGADVIAVDLDPTRCREAGTRVAGDPPGGGGHVSGVVCGDGERLPLASNAVAFVHCAQVLEHVVDPAALLAELRRVLVPSGYAYVTAINRFALRDPHFHVLGVNFLPRAVADRLLVAMGAVNSERQTLGRMHYFSRRAFQRLCRRSGLEVVVDVKRRQRLERSGAIGGRIADLWGTVKSAAFHVVVQRPAAADSVPPGSARDAPRASQPRALR